MGKDMKYVLLLGYYGSILTDKQRNAMELYYYDDLSLSEIAEHTLTTRQGVHDNIRRAEHYLDEMEKKLGFLRSINTLSDILSEVGIYSKSMVSLAKDGNTQEVIKLAENVSQLVENGKNFLIDFGT